MLLIKWISPVPMQKNQGTIGRYEHTGRRMGGKFQSQEISAKQGTGVESLLEKILLEAELLDVKANPDKFSTGTVIEATSTKDGVMLQHSWCRKVPFMQVT